MNVTWISHLINLCEKCVFNAQYQCVKCTNYEWMNLHDFVIRSWDAKFVMYNTSSSKKVHSKKESTHLKKKAF
jgi:hypothetical protein